MISGKHDFMILISANLCNPNGDPLASNEPRTLIDGRGIITDVCLKHKVRNALHDTGESILVISPDYANDGHHSLLDRLRSVPEIAKLSKEWKKDDADKISQYKKLICDTWLDVRSFGQVIAYKEPKVKDGVSVHVQGPVSISNAVSVCPVNIMDLQITKCIRTNPDSNKADTMGHKMMIEHGLYIATGSINANMAERTGLTDADVDKIKDAILHMFENDASSARPAGSMKVEKLIWWTHPSKNPKHSLGELVDTVGIAVKEGITDPKKFDDYSITIFTGTPNVKVEVLS